MVRMQRMGAIALTAVLGLGLVACGGDDDNAQEGEGDPTTTTAASDGTTTTGDIDLGDFTGECAGFAQAFSEAGTAVGEAFSGGSAEDLEQVADYFGEVADRVPEEIRDDFQIFADAYGEFAQALADSGVDLSDPSTMDPENAAQLQALAGAFSAPEVQTASENIQTWVSENCKGG